MGIYFSWILIVSIKMVTQKMDGCLILNKLGRRRVKLPESDGNTAMLTLKMGAFLLGFSCPTQTLLLLGPILLGPGEATHSELLGVKRVNRNCFCWDLTCCRVQMCTHQAEQCEGWMTAYFCLQHPQMRLWWDGGTSASSTQSPIAMMPPPGGKEPL